jgi:hypothetical protein
MDEVSRLSGEDSYTRDDFLAAVKTLSHVNHDPDFYRLAVKALTDSPVPFSKYNDGEHVFITILIPQVPTSFSSMCLNQV